MLNLQIIRTALFVPGARPDRMEKALSLTGDAVIVDLEDAVVPEQKAAARAQAREFVARNPDRNIIVRVNSLCSDLISADLEAVAVHGLKDIILPKTESAADIEQIHDLLSAMEKKAGLPLGSIGVIPLIESAKAVRDVDEIMSAKSESQRIVTAAFGAADYSLDMGIELSREGTELIYPRSRIAVACRAAGVAPPLDTPWLIDLKDEAGLRADAVRAKGLGFQGKLCIHPNQLAVCNQVFSPSAEEIAWARKVVEAFEQAKARGTGALQIDGKFIDLPIVEKSRRILAVADQ